jgi:hypothetical protein
MLGAMQIRSEACASTELVFANPSGAECGATKVSGQNNNNKQTSKQTNKQTTKKREMNVYFGHIFSLQTT